MIRKTDDIMILETEHTSYIMGLLPTGQLEHLYYGRKIHINGAGQVESFREKHAFAPGNATVYDKEHSTYSLEDMALEYSGLGKGDYRVPALELVFSDGSRTCDFVFSGWERIRKEEDSPLPRSYGEERDREHIAAVFRDEDYGLKLELHYVVYSDCDVITRYAVLVNESGDPVQIESLMSMCLDMPKRSLVIHSFHGAWAREMHHSVTPAAGRYVIESRTGNSSSRANPFFMVSDPDTTEMLGDCYGFNLIYSGNHSESVEVSAFGKTRIVSGINPEGFSWKLNPGERFETPEAVMTFSPAGFNGMSDRMHRFVRRHVIRGYWREKTRPVLFNSWEACYFDINEKKMLRLARQAKDLGAELVVMDDGWFGKRNDDTSSLGDWYVNHDKIPHGLGYLSERINDMGLEFGLWVEPEMVNVDSDLYRAHPDWTLDIPGRPHSEGRNQRILDLSRMDVQDYIINTLSDLFSGCSLSYVKWDMNRNMSDVYSKDLSPDCQGETAHRYILGLYRVMRSLTEKFPEILFEGCASGGDRFDLGILSYFPQIWASDDTDAVERLDIQQGYSYGYPLISLGSHVSASPNHQTLRRTPLSTRVNVSSFGAMGFELNPDDLTREEKSQICEYISRYRQWRDVFQKGRFFRGVSAEDNVTWNVVSEDGSRAAALLAEKRVHPDDQYRHLRVSGLKKEAQYQVMAYHEPVNIRDFGSLVNMASPVHVKPDSAVLRLISRYVKFQEPEEQYTAFGDSLALAGITSAPAFAGTGYSDKVRLSRDGSSRMYYITEKSGDFGNTDMIPF